MPKRRNSGHDDGHVDESWAVPYADMMTLLLALFLALFVISTLDAEKFEEMKRAFNVVLTGEGDIMDYPESMQDISPTVMSLPDVKDINTHNQNEMTSLEELKEQLDTYISQSNLENSLKTSLSNDGLKITITNDVLFDSGKVVVKQESIYLAEEIGKMLEERERKVMISGHTDNVPMNNDDYESNWDLSVARAVSFMKIMVGHSKLTENLMSVKGYGEFDPIATNEAPEGRAKNRRVEVLVIPNYLSKTEIEETTSVDMKNQDLD